jgi:ABC-type branched-subunit amino acid transport system substrate-binding protein
MRKTTRIASLLCLALLLVALPLVAACGDDDEDKTPTGEEKWITIGGTHTLSGTVASSTAPAFQTLVEMLRYINEAEGGIDGIKINYVWADDKYDPATAAIALKRLRGQHHPVLWLNWGPTFMFAGAKDMFQRDGTPALFYTAYSPDLLEPGSMFFAYGFNLANNFTGVVRWVLQDWEASGGMGTPKLGYLHWDMPHGTAPLNVGADRWAEEHGVDVVTRTYAPMQLDLRSHLLALKDEGADYVYLCGTLAEHATLVRDARAAGLWDEMKFIIGPSSDPYSMVLPLVGEDAEGLYQFQNNQPWTAGPEVARALRIQQEISVWAGHSPERGDIASTSVTKAILTAVVRQAVADVGYENLSGEAMYNALLRVGPIDTQGGFRLGGWTEDRRVGQSGIVMTQYQKMAPGSPVPPDGIMMETVAVSDWIETTNIFEGEW